jgi:hypothetical protein
MKKRTVGGGSRTTRTVRARVAHGNLALLEPLDLPEGSEVDVTVAPVPSAGEVAGAPTVEEIIRSTSGAWADLLDCEELERTVYERRHRHRAPVQL